MTSTSAGAAAVPAAARVGRAGPAVTWAGRYAAPVTFAVFGLIDILVFGLHAHGTATFAFTPEFAKVSVPNLPLPAAVTCFVCGAVTLVLAVVRLLSLLGRLALGKRAAGWRSAWCCSPS